MNAVPQTPITSTALTEYDFVVVVDASGSMSTEDAPGGKSRWTYMQETLLAFTRDIEKIDSDGIGLVVFGGSNITSKDGVTSANLGEVFAGRRPMGNTPLKKALQAALQLAGKSAKKDFILVFTDGVPDDPAGAAQVLVSAANNQQSDDALTFLFVQVGKDPSATSYLANLDDGLSGAKWDIVDAMTIEKAEQFASTADMVIAAING